MQALRIRASFRLTCNQTVMSGRIIIGFVDFLAFSSEIDRFVALR